MIQKYKYDSLYYGGPYSYSENEAPVIKAKVYSPGSDKGTDVIFCLDTGADNRVIIPDFILKKLGSVVDESYVVGFDGIKQKEKNPIYSVGLRIDDLNYDELVLAVGTKNQFGLLPRSIINQWTILFDAPNGEFTITTYD